MPISTYRSINIFALKFKNVLYLQNILHPMILRVNALRYLLHRNSLVVTKEHGICQQQISPRLALDVPPGAVDKEVQLEIECVDETNAPCITCELGETILSNIVQIKPVEGVAITFKKSAILSYEHCIEEKPEHSTIAILWYNNSNRKWEKLPHASGGV